MGATELIQQISSSGGGSLDFGKCVAVPGMMPQLGRIARILGPKGLMPNPKLGTVTHDVATVSQGCEVKLSVSSRFALVLFARLLWTGPVCLSCAHRLSIRQLLPFSWERAMQQHG